MALPAEINMQRMKGDSYPIVFSMDQDYSDTDLVLVTETANLTPVIMTAEQATFPGEHFSTFDTGSHPYKITITSLGMQRTLVMGMVQIVDDNLLVTP